MIVAIEALIAALGRLCAWGALAMVAIQAVLVFARHLFAAPSLLGLPIVASQEAIVYAFAFLLMGALADGLRAGAHVRIDALYGRLGAKARATIDLAGAIFLLTPFTLALILSSWPNVVASFLAAERSLDPSGLPGRWLLKASILIGASLLALQGAATAARAVETLRR